MSINSSMSTLQEIFYKRRVIIGMVILIFGGLFIYNGFMYLDVSYPVVLLVCAFFAYMTAKWVVNPVNTNEAEE